MGHGVSLVSSTSARRAPQCLARLIRVGPYRPFPRCPGHRSGHNPGPLPLPPPAKCPPVDLTPVRPCGRPWAALDETVARPHLALPRGGRAVALREVVGRARPLLLICRPARACTCFQGVAVSGRARRCAGYPYEAVQLRRGWPTWCCRRRCRRAASATLARRTGPQGQQRPARRRYAGAAYHYRVNGGAGVLLLRAEVRR
jgi:hypothetical protein